MTHGGRIPSAKMRPSTPRAWAQSAAPTSKSDPDDQPRKKIWKGAQKSTCKKVGSPSRPPNLAAAARRACQGWPRLRGHPGLALTGPSTAACCIGRARKGPHHNLTRYGAWPRQFPTATPASKFHRRDTSSNEGVRQKLRAKWAPNLIRWFYMEIAAGNTTAAGKCFLDMLGVFA